ncbi:hydantoinase/oxoprolinase family protein [Candidatus Halobonum tyrrellensis]|uniref:5-oxoprolinase n=1 Tax=Candidatus Halobonum tyrrellensis G22 TaxID=1324957 RepID=V4HLH8_9EURY|nr:hydantoinase/oxoprolinase family protein [Candidatus Halobonum tyrrellensis]ESP88784.1 5-oxoprolinase [Candidatus Halobonum tyrrellensis G22]
MDDSDGAGTRVGVDVGGTFTDLVTVRDGRVRVDKTPSTPDAPEEGVLTGLGGLDAPLAEVDFLGHGTTVATNAVLEGEWADTALVTTAGFRDALEIGRQTRPDIYDFDAEKPTPVVERDRRFEVPGRVDERGEVLEPLDEDAVRALADDLPDSVDSVAVALLFSFEHPGHERRVRDLLCEAGVEASVSLSSDVLPEVREYERTLATSLNAALKPVMDDYLGSLAEAAADEGLTAPLRVMGSNGGLMAAAAARERPVNTLLSGPAAGVRGATHVAGRRGVSDLITMDMGGTSCDVSLVRDGDPLVTTDTEVGDYPVAVPTVDVHTVGAGGGSIAHVDAGGALRVGPASAGADPGPVCYGRGGTRPTVTDAHLLLGRIDPTGFLPDALGRDASAVREAFDPLADAVGGSVADAAAGVLRVANANMERALRVVSVERGYDPREFTLVAFGGAGPLHATALAGALDVPRVVVPRAAGVLSALGLLISDVTYDYATSMVRPWPDVDAATLDAKFAEFEAEGGERLRGAGHDDSEIRFERTLDLRYAGQSFDLSVPVEGEATEAELDAAVARFHDAHERRYGHAYREEPVELVTVRLRARGLVEPPDLAVDERAGDPADARVGTREVTFGAVRDTPVYYRSRLPTDAAFDGPAVVEGGESTVVVHPGQTARVDADANIVVETGGEAGA